MHLCSKCSMPTLVFGILFLVANFTNYVPGGPWTVAGVYMLLWGIMSMMK